MSTPNPLSGSDTKPGPSVSKKQFTIAGILTTVYGLDELTTHPSITEVACLWLLHPRLQTQACMEPLAAACLTHFYDRLDSPSAHDDPTPPKRGLIAVAFDQRNHGSREVNPLANESWRTGNPLHAQDLFSSYRASLLPSTRDSSPQLTPHPVGTALDTSLLIDHLASYIFPASTHTLADNLVLGISLGGHAAWTLILSDPRLSAAIVVIGCPDFLRLITDRAAKSKLQTWTSSSPPGATFLGSEDLPIPMLDAVRKWDPAGLLMSGPNDELWRHSETQAPRRKESLLAKRLGGKRILDLAGGEDKLVPVGCSKPFLDWLEAQAEAGKVELVRRVYDGVGHEMSEGMVKEAVAFVADHVEKVGGRMGGEGRAGAKM